MSAHKWITAAGSTAGWYAFCEARESARDQVIKVGLATLPQLLVAVSQEERVRVDAILDNILLVSARAAGLHADTAVGTHLAPTPLASIRVPTRIISA